MNMADIFRSNASHATEFFLDSCRNLTSGGAPDPVSLEIHPTLRCDLDCRYCFTTAERHRSPGASMPPGRQDAIMRWIESRSAIRSIVLSGGGEPLLNPGSLLDRLVVHCARTKILLAVLTNALALPQLLLSRLGELPLYVNVSLKGVNRESFRAVTGADFFSRQIQSLRILTRARRRSEYLLVSVRLVLDGILAEQVPVSQVAVFLDSLIQDGVDIALLTFSNPDTQGDPGLTRRAYSQFQEALHADQLVGRMLSVARDPRPRLCRRTKHDG